MPRVNDGMTGALALSPAPVFFSREDVWFLSPGIGAQGGDLAAALGAGLRSDGLGMLLPISRGPSNQTVGANVADLSDQCETIY